MTFTISGKKNDPEQSRKLKKQISNIEREISRIENEIAQLEIKLADPGFYSLPEFMDVNNKYKTLQNNLEKKMEEWEILSTEVEHFI